MQGKGIIRIGKGSNLLYIPQKWSSKYNWTAGETVQVLVGRKQATAAVRLSKSSQLALSRDLYEQLKLHPFPISWKTEDDRIQLGPFIAAYSLYTEDTDKPFADNTNLFIDMTMIARKLYTPFYVITPGGFHADSDTVTGWLYNIHENQWKRAELPWPDFCIKKQVVVPDKWRSEIQEDQVLICLSGCKLLTRTLGSKWDVHLQLLNNPAISPYLPDTRRFLSIQDIDSMLRLHSIVYVKPVNGTQGRGICRFTKLKDRVRIEYQMKDQIKSKIIYLNKNRNWIQRRFTRTGNYLIQQALSLVKNDNGQPVDFRWLVQKDGTGNWQITARVARIAGKGNITTNVSTGGDVVNAADFLGTCGFGKPRVTSSVRKLDGLALKIVKSLEKMHGSMGELGIDFGIDKTGKPWIIEVNTRPGRKMLRILDSELRELSLRRPLEYARYTIGFGEP